MTYRTVVGVLNTPFIKFFEGVTQGTTLSNPVNLPAGNSNYTNGIAISPNGRYAAALDLSTRGFNVYDMSVNPPLRVATQTNVFPSPATLAGIAFSPDGNTIAIQADIPPFVKTVTTAPWTGAPVSAVSYPGSSGNPSVSGLVWSLDSTVAYGFGQTDASVRKMTFSGGTLTYDSVAFTPTFPAGANSGYGLRLSPDGKTMAAFRAGGVTFWSSADGKTGWTQIPNGLDNIGTNGLIDFAWKPDGTEFALGHVFTPFIRRYTWPAITPITSGQPAQFPQSIGYAPDTAELLAVNGETDGSIQVINLISNTYSKRNIGAFGSTPLSIHMVRTPTSDDGVLVVGDVATPYAYFYDQNMVRITSITMTMPTNLTAACAVSWDHKIAIMDYGTRKILIGQWNPDARTITPVTTFDWPGIANASDYASVLKFSPDGTRLLVLAASTAPRAWMYDTATWSQLPGLPSFGSMYNADFSFDGTKVVFTSSTAPYIHIYDMATFTLQSGPSITLPTRNVRWSPSGKLLAISCDGGGTTPSHRVYRTDTWASITLPSVPNTGPGLYNGAMIDIVEVSTGIEHVAFSSDQATKQLIYSINTSTYVATLQSAPTGGANSDGLTSRGMQYDGTARWVYGLEASGGASGRRVTKFNVLTGGVVGAAVLNPYNVTGVTQATVQPGGTGGGGFDMASNIGRRQGGGSPPFVAAIPYPQVNIVQ